MLNPKKLLVWTLLGLVVAQSTLVQGTDSRFARLVRRSHDHAHQQHHKRIAATTAASALAAGAFGAPVERTIENIPEADKLPHAWEKKDVGTVTYKAVARGDSKKDPEPPVWATGGRNGGDDHRKRTQEEGFVIPGPDPGHGEEGKRDVSATQDHDEAQHLAARQLPKKYPIPLPPSGPDHEKRTQGGGEIVIGHDPYGLNTRTQGGGGAVTGPDPSHGGGKRDSTTASINERIQGGGENVIGHDPYTVTTRYVAVNRRTQGGGEIVIGHDPYKLDTRTQGGGEIVIGHDPTGSHTKRTQGGGGAVTGPDPSHGGGKREVQGNDKRTQNEVNLIGPDPGNGGGGKKRTQGGGGAVTGPDPGHNGGQKRTQGEVNLIGPPLHGGKKRTQGGGGAVTGPAPGNNGGGNKRTQGGGGAVTGPDPSHGGKKRTQNEVNLIGPPVDGNKKRTQGGGGAVTGPDPSHGGKKRTQGGNENIIIGPPRSLVNEERTQGGGGAVTGPPVGGGKKRTQAGGGIVIGPDPGNGGGRKRTQGGGGAVTGPDPSHGGKRATTPFDSYDAKRTQGGGGAVTGPDPSHGGKKRTQGGGGAVTGPDPSHGGRKRTQGGENIIIGPPRSLDDDAEDGSNRHLVSRGMLPLGDGSYFAKHGRVTWYDGHMMDNPACGGKRPSENEFVVAVPKMLQSKCGYTIEIHHNHKTVKAKVVDYCADCENHHLDVSPQVFKALAPLDEGDLKDIHYRVLAKGMH